MSVAQLPGSMYPTLTRYAGPAKANIRFQKETWPVSTLAWTSASERVSPICPVVTIDLTIVKFRGNVNSCGARLPDGLFDAPCQSRRGVGFLQEFRWAEILKP